jgi:hypothetical protein
VTAKAGAASRAGHWEALKTALRGRSDPWTDLGLTLPVFLGYHIGVAFLPKRNAVDFMSSLLAELAGHSILAYLALTIAVGGGLVGTLVLMGRGHRLSWKRFGLVLVEGAAYAIALRVVASYVVGTLRLGAGDDGAFTGLVMSLGAGFYEELAFRVVLFGLGAMLLTRVVKKRPWLWTIAWAAITSMVFSAWHYFGPFGDPFGFGSFVFRTVCGLAFVAVYRFRGFAPAVWSHALYDIWLLVF